LNDDGSGAIGRAFVDSDVNVKLSALASAVRVNVLSGLGNLAGLTADGNVDVRRRAVEVLDALGAKDAVAAVAAAAQNDKDAGVRTAACHALGTFGDASARPVLQKLVQSDPDTFVRDQAQIALLRL
jgi:HEAT repeat protein